MSDVVPTDPRDLRLAGLIELELGSRTWALVYRSDNDEGDRMVAREHYNILDLAKSLEKIAAGLRQELKDD